MDKKIHDLLQPTEILAQMAEEASELAQAALKLRRTLDGTNPTPIGANEAAANLYEELADVQVCTNAFLEQFDDDYTDDLIEAINNMEKTKYKRWINGLEEREDNK